MKTSPRIFLILFQLIFLSSFSMGQSVSDTTMVLQKCINLPVLQQHYSCVADGYQIPVHIMQYNVKFSTNIEISKFGQNVVFMKRPEIYYNRIEGFFVIELFVINKNTAEVKFAYNYDFNTEQNAVMASLIMQKKDNNWEISESKIAKR